MFQGALRSLLPKLEGLSNSKTVLGEPVSLGEITLVPVISLRVALGAGHSEGINTGGGAGGINVEPRAVLVIQGERVSCFSLGHGDKIEELAKTVPGLSHLWQQEQDYSGDM